MSITLLTTSKQEYYSSVGNYDHCIYPNNYLIVESNATGNANFYFNVQISVGAVLVREWNLVPNSPSRLTTNITKLLYDYLTGIDKPDKTDLYKQLTASAISITVNEYYSGSLQDTDTLNVTMRKQLPRTLVDEKYYDYKYWFKDNKIFQTKYTGAKYYQTSVNVANYFSVCLQKYNQALQIQTYTLVVVVYVGSPQYSHTVFTGHTPGVDVEVITYNLTRIFNLYLSAYLDTATEVHVLCSNDINHSYQELTYKVVKNCGNLLNIAFRNDFGVFETMTFVNKCYDTENVLTTYNKNNYLYQGDYFKGGLTNVNNIQKTKLTAWTDWLNPDDVQYIANSIMASKEVYLQEVDASSNWVFTELTPITGTNHFTSVDFEELQNCSITFEKESYDNL